MGIPAGGSYSLGMNARDRVNEAIARAYEAFADVPQPRTLDAAPHHDAVQILERLTAAPLAEIPDERIGPYAGSAMTTIGTVRDYQHFLPRILALAISDSAWPGTTPEIIAAKFIYGGRENWSRDQLTAVLDVFENAFRLAIESHPDDGLAAEDWLCGLARIGPPIAPCLDLWREASTPGAALQLARFIATNKNSLRRDRSASRGFWEEVPPSEQRRAGAWLLAPETRTQLVKAHAEMAPEDVWEIDIALAEFDQMET